MSDNKHSTPTADATCTSGSSPPSSILIEEPQVGSNMLSCRHPPKTTSAAVSTADLEERFSVAFREALEGGVAPADLLDSVLRSAIICIELLHTTGMAGAYEHDCNSKVTLFLFSCTRSLNESIRQVPKLMREFFPKNARG